MTAKKDLLYPVLLIAFLSVVVNVSLAVFNLIPIPPLDGFGVVESLVPPSAIPAVIWLRRYGFLILDRGDVHRRPRVHHEPGAQLPSRSDLLR